MRMHTFRAMNTDLLFAVEECLPLPFGAAHVPVHPHDRLSASRPAQADQRAPGVEVQPRASLLELAYPASPVTALFEEVENMVRAYEQQFTRFSEDSELSALNRAAGGWFAASPEMLEVVRLALDMHRASGGLFNPAVLPSLEAAGYDRSMDELRSNGSQAFPAPRSFQRVFGRPDFGHVQINERLEAIRLPDGMRIDLGGIAKGWIGQRAAERLARAGGAALVDAGGDLFACGLPAGARSWTIAVEDPFNPQQNAAVIEIQPGAVATSTTLRRRWKQHGQVRHHLIDPATGAPTDSLWASVTAVVPASAAGNEGARAEVLAKAMLIGGPIQAAAMLERFPGAYFIAIDQNGKAWESANMPVFA